MDIYHWKQKKIKKQEALGVKLEAGFKDVFTFKPQINKKSEQIANQNKIELLLLSKCSQ